MTSAVAPSGVVCFMSGLHRPVHHTAHGAGLAAVPASAAAAARTMDDRGDTNATGEAVMALVLHAAKQEQRDAVRALLTSENNLRLLLQDDQQAARSLFEHAVQSGEARLLDELLRSGLHDRVECCQRFVSRLVVAIVHEGDVEMLTTLLQSARVDLQPESDSMDESEPAPLVLAVQQDNESLISVLLDHGADPNAQSNDAVAWTALHIAAEWGNSNVVTRLVHAGANSEARSFEGETPLHIAVLSNHIDSTNALLGAGADVNARNEHGQTPLHIASIEGSTSVMISLLQHGALVDARDENGCTPLHIGAFFDENGARFARGVDDTQAAVVSLLLKHGADIGICDHEGNTVLESARRDKYDVIVDLLVDHMQRQSNTRRRLDDRTRKLKCQV